LDISPLALERARKLVPQAEYIEAPAEALPFAGDGFDLVHTSVALHEMDREQLDKIFSEVYRVLRLGGFFAFIDLHSPTSPLFWPPLALFMALFETQTAWELLKIDLVANLKAVGFRNCHQYLYAGGSLQVIQAQK
jgi:demethylmenaquinone methyltransferase/2-methoxy-6-polyprenyl-1,4-benzoquinol methylase